MPMEKVFLFEATQARPEGNYRAQFYAVADKSIVADVVKINNGEVTEIAETKLVTNSAGQIIRVPWFVLYEALLQNGCAVRRLADDTPRAQLFGKICLNGLMRQVCPRRTVFRKMV